MTVMERPYRVGDRVRIERCPPFTLPDELPPGTEATVTRSEPGTTEVRDAAGREWRVSMCCVTAGKLYQLRSEQRWRPADDPQVRAELARMLAMERARLDDCDASQRVVLDGPARAWGRSCKTAGEPSHMNTFRSFDGTKIAFHDEGCGSV
jgi:hypothetical protein